MIIDFEKGIKTPFRVIFFGEVFKYDKKVYMRVVDCTANNMECNAIDLETGHFIHIPMKEEVFRMDARLVIS